MTNLPDPTFNKFWKLLTKELQTYMLNDIVDSNLTERMATSVNHIFNVGTIENPVFDYSQGAVVYNKIAKFMYDHVTYVYDNVHFFNGNVVLAEYLSQWNILVTKIPEVIKIFNCLQENWIKFQRDNGNLKVSNISTLCYTTARTSFFLQLEPKLSWTLQDMIINEQYGEPLNTKLVKQTIQTYLYFGNGDANDPGKIYRFFFEEKLLHDFKKVFKNLKRNCVPHHGKDMCATKMSQQYYLETQTIWGYLHPTTWPKIKLNFDEWQDDHNNAINEMRAAAREKEEALAESSGLSFFTDSESSQICQMVKNVEI